MYALTGGNYIYLIISIVSLMTWLTGIGVGWPSPIVAKLEKFNTTSDYPFKYAATEDEITWITSVSSISSIIGILLFTNTADFFGRKKLILTLNSLYIVSYGILTFANTVYLYIIAQFILGAAQGSFMCVLPHYTNEICLQHNRGLLALTTILMMFFGIVCAYSLGPYTSIQIFHMIFFIVSALFFPLFYFIAPETPYYLMSQGNESMALVSLKRVRSCNNEALLEELEDIKKNTRKETENSHLLIFKDPFCRKITCILVGLIILQQLSGISVIMAYSQSFFERSGSSVPPEICPIIIGVLQLFSGAISALTCDKFGRKILLVMSSIGSGMPLAILGVYFYLSDDKVDVDDVRWLPLGCLVVTVVFYSCGLGILPFLVVAESLPTNVKLMGSTITTIVYSLVTFLLYKFYRAVADMIGMETMMWVFSGVCFVTAVYVHFIIVETKGKTLNEIQHALGNKRQS